jgi:hypothetical protein
MKPRPYCASALLAAVIVATGSAAFAEQADPAIASLPARHSPEWLKSGVIYQVFVPSLSPSVTKPETYCVPFCFAEQLWGTHF